MIAPLRWSSTLRPMLDRWQEFWGRLSGRAQRTAIAVTAVAAVVVFVGYWIIDDSSHDAQRY